MNDERLARLAAEGDPTAKAVAARRRSRRNDWWRVVIFEGIIGLGEEHIPLTWSVIHLVDDILLHEFAMETKGGERVMKTWRVHINDPVWHDTRGWRLIEWEVEAALRDLSLAWVEHHR